VREGGREVHGRGHAVDIVRDMKGACHCNVRIRSHWKLVTAGPAGIDGQELAGLLSHFLDKGYYILTSEPHARDCLFVFEISCVSSAKHVCACGFCAKLLPHTPLRRAHTPGSSSTIKLEAIKTYLLSFPELFMLKVPPAPPLIICSRELRGHTRSRSN